jgi:N-acetylglucosaminyldiphosphoundecaprenol N-acetyl-beta-D-mannosaminyltransferase
VNMVTPDGMSVVWLLQLKGYKIVRRVYGPDLMLAACSQGRNLNQKHFFLGGKPGVAKKMADNLQDRFSGLQVSGTYSPPFRSLQCE